jgi:hypothetical protein
MPRFLRVFFCKKCQNQATLDSLTDGMSVIECIDCDVAEIWSHEVNAKLDHFLYVDEPVAKAAGGWMN